MLPYIVLVLVAICVLYRRTRRSRSTTAGENKLLSKVLRAIMTKYCNTMQKTRTVAFLVTGLWLLMTLFYNNNNNNNNWHTSRFEIKTYRNIMSYNGTEDYLINTKGCYIPNYAKTLKFTEATDEKSSCGKRSVFIDKDVNNITFRIDDDLLQKYHKAFAFLFFKWYKCCYRFASLSTEPGKEESPLTYSECKTFKNGTTVRLQDEVVLVSCSNILTRNPFYEDAYMFVKKIEMSPSSNGTHFNVLILGLDTMSRSRFYSTMPKTASYFEQHDWLDYRGYQKVGSNTYPNLMSFLTGLKMSTIKKICTKGMNKCNDALIWSKFKKQGYVTAYGEEFVSLPDTFGFPNPNRFVAPPTDHYMRPLFLTNETSTGNLVCTKQMPSALSALNYALDFVKTYKDNKFFGLFWLNSYSHNFVNLPTLLDDELSIFLDKLTITDAISKTFIFFLSDHGIRFGYMKLPVESYYETRLPMFFMKVPRQFTMFHADAAYNLKVNENRLTTPYDLYGTFAKILQFSSGLKNEEKPDACPQCTSLFDVQSEYRTCASAGVDEKWCSCHNFTSVDINAQGAATSIELAVAKIQNMSKSIKTIRCTKCKTFRLKKVLRAHVDFDDVHNKTKYIIAFQLSPGNLIYEASILEDKKGFSVIHIESARNIWLSVSKTFTYCIIGHQEWDYCICAEDRKCQQVHVLPSPSTHA